MQVNVAGLRRNIKNLAHNYSDAQVKVREATSNDPWGPSATIMAEIADLTYNVVAFSEIMQMIWKRLNDHGKNWRHVYKALILLEYLIKTGTEKVAQQCTENIFAIQTLREFVHFEEGKDHGTHVREKAKQLVILLKDDERLKNERIKALKAKERFAQHPSGFGSDGYIDGPTHRDMPPGWQDEPTKSVSDLELVRPQTAGEEELQLQLAMAMSREEAEQEEAKRRSDDVRLQLALSQSEQDFKQQKQQKDEPQSHLLDLLDISLGATSLSNSSLGATGNNVASTEPWPAGIGNQMPDPWTGTGSPPVDPWLPSGSSRNISLANTEMNTLGGITMTVAATNGVSDSWGIRTQSPSVTSGSSTEGWLQTNGLNDNIQPTPAAANSDPWLAKSTALSPTAATISQNVLMDPWLTPESTKSAPAPAVAINSLGLDDPWAPKAKLPSSQAIGESWRHNDNVSIKKPSPDLDEFDIITNRNKTGDLLAIDKPTNNAVNNNANAPPISTSGLGTNTKKPLKTPQAFLGENSALVNLDNLIKPAAPQPGGNISAYNPFSDTIIPSKSNLFQQQQPPGPSINQLKQQPFAVNMSQDPWAPISNANPETTQVQAAHQRPNVSNLYSTTASSQALKQQQVNLNYSKSDFEVVNTSNIVDAAVTAVICTTNNNIECFSKNTTNTSNILTANCNADLLLNDNNSSDNSHFSLYPQVNIINNNNNMEKFNLCQVSSLNLSSVNKTAPFSPNLLPELDSSLQDINNYNEQLIGSSDISSPKTSLIQQTVTTTTATTATMSVTSYCSVFSTSLATIPGVTIRPLTSDTLVDPNTNLFNCDLYDSNDLNNTNQCKFENNNNMPWMKSETMTSNPFLS